MYALTAKETVEKILRKEITAEECILSILERIHRLEDRIHAFVTLVEEEAIKKARKIDEKVSEGKSGKPGDSKAEKESQRGNRDNALNGAAGVCSAPEFPGTWKTALSG